MPHLLVYLQFDLLAVDWGQVEMAAGLHPRVFYGGVLDPRFIVPICTRRC